MKTIELAPTSMSKAFVANSGTVVAAAIGFVVCAITDSSVSIRPSFENFQFNESTPKLVTFTETEISITYESSIITLLTESNSVANQLRLWVNEFEVKMSKQDAFERQTWIECRNSLRTAARI